MNTNNSAAPNISQTQAVPNPNLSDVLNLNNQNLMVRFNCHHIGIVQAFNAANQTCQATIAYQKTSFQFDSETGLYDPILVPYTMLADCPAIIMGGGNTGMTTPISAGDECLVLFNDRSLANWFAQGAKASGQGVSSSRLHSFADGLILVGARSLPNVIKNYDLNHIMLRGNLGAGAYGAVGVNKNNQKVLLTNNFGGNTLNDLLQQLITAIKAITVTGVQTGGGTSGTPANAATFTSIASSIAGLLE